MRRFLRVKPPAQQTLASNLPINKLKIYKNCCGPLKKCRKLQNNLKLYIHVQYTYESGDDLNGPQQIDKKSSTLSSCPPPFNLSSMYLQQGVGRNNLLMSALYPRVRSPYTQEHITLETDPDGSFTYIIQEQLHNT